MPAREPVARSQLRLRPLNQGELLPRGLILSGEFRILELRMGRKSTPGSVHSVFPTSFHSTVGCRNFLPPSNVERAAKFSMLFFGTKHASPKPDQTQWQLVIRIECRDTSARGIEGMKAPAAERVSRIRRRVGIEPKRITTARDDPEVRTRITPVIPQWFVRHLPKRGQHPSPARKAQPDSPLSPPRSLCQDLCRAHPRVGGWRVAGSRTSATAPIANRQYLAGMPR